MNYGKIMKSMISTTVEEQVNRVPKAVGSFGYDPWGYHEDYWKYALTMSKWLYEKYFRVETFGLENIPAQGRVLVIANHAGQFFPADGLMIATAVAMSPQGPRLVRGMIERFFPVAPFLGNWVNRTGSVLGDPFNCKKMLENDEAVMVFPEGERGAIKAWKYRYQLQRMGTGFVRMAIETRTPIVPVGVIGTEEATPGLGRGEKIGKLLNTPPFPFAIPVILPVKIRLHFGKPMHMKGNLDSEEEMVVLAKQVRTEMERLIQEGLHERQSVFF
ncbi:lysophospholipid acyltransferase family protein [Deltaproteobacteria bacterium TL4]